MRGFLFYIFYNAKSILLVHKASIFSDNFENVFEHLCDVFCRSEFNIYFLRFWQLGRVNFRCVLYGKCSLTNRKVSIFSHLQAIFENSCFLPSWRKVFEHRNLNFVLRNSQFGIHFVRPISAWEFFKISILQCSKPVWCLFAP